MQGGNLKVYIIHQYESCEYGEYYGIFQVYSDETKAILVANRLTSEDGTFDYNVEEQEVINEIKG